MQSAPKPDNEVDRIEKLKRYQILDTSPEEVFDRITRIVGDIIGVPIALVSLIDSDRQWFKSKHGLDADETPRELAFCAHAILDDGLFVVEDASQDSRFADNPLVISGPEIRFYAGAPLRTPDGLNLGTLCAIDQKPRKLTPQQSQLLTDLARVVMDELELRIALRDAMGTIADEVSLSAQKDTFIAMVSHELRTPLTSIRGSLGILEGGAVKDIPDKAMDLLTLANRNVSKLMGLIDDLLDFQKSVYGNLTFDFETLDVETVVRETCENMAGLAHQKNVKIRIENDAWTTIVGDSARLSQVLVNLLSNAIKFSPENDEVIVAVRLQDAVLHIDVTDNGAGVPEGFHDQIFEFFSQAPGENKSKGSGLGLTISKVIVEAHRGKIRLDSDTSSGTTFQIELPIHQTVIAD